jgi:hypothetical protein
MQYIMETETIFSLPPLSYPRLLVGLSLIFPSLPSVSYPVGKGDDSRKRLDFPLFRILLHSHSFTLSLGICLDPESPYHQHIKRT